MAEVIVVYNDDVAGFYARLNRFITEMVKSMSANITDFAEADIKRLKTYLLGILTYLDWVVGEPEMDFHETHPLEIQLAAAPAVPQLENPMIADAVRLLVRVRDEMVSSQSARRASGLVAFDNDRARAAINRVQRYLTDYVEKVTPIDLPESSPKAPMTGSGRTGV